MSDRSYFKAALLQTGKQVGYICSFAIVVLMIVGFAQLLYSTAYFLVENLKLPELIVISVLTFITGLFLFNYCTARYGADESTAVRLPNPWEDNTGDCPPFKRVCLKLSSGDIKWDIDPNQIDWSVSANDPVIKFKKYNRR